MRTFNFGFPIVRLNCGISRDRFRTTYVSILEYVRKWKLNFAKAKWNLYILARFKKSAFCNAGEIYNGCNGSSIFLSNFPMIFLVYYNLLLAEIKRANAAGASQRRQNLSRF